MQRMAAVFLEGTELLDINACTFTRLDGNAVMLSGYHRNATIRNCDFSWTGLVSCLWVRDPNIPSEFIVIL